MSTAFRPKGVSAARASGARREVKDYARTRLASVDGYDIARGIMHATELDSGLKLEVTMQKRERTSAPTAASASRTPSEKKWRGDSIDEMMAEALVPGADTWVILEACRGGESVMKGKDRVMPVQARWILNVTEPRADKCFTGIFTIKGYRDHVDQVQHWAPKSMNASNQADLDAFGDKLDTIAADFAERKYPIRSGFQFRLLKPVEAARSGRDGKVIPPTYEEIDMSFPIDWLSADNAADPEDRGRPPAKADFQNYVNMYIDHVWGTDPGAELAEGEERIAPKFPAEVLDKVIFEIKTYDIYRAGDAKYNERMFINEPEPGRPMNRLWTMANTPTRFAEGEEPSVGKNIAVLGVLQLVPDSFDKKTSTLNKNMMARQLFVDGPIGHVSKFINASDGGRVNLLPALDRELTQRAETPAAGAASSGGLAAASGDPLSGVESPFGADAGSFLDAGESEFLGAGAAAPAAPAPAAEATPAPAADAAPAGARPARFARPAV